MPFHTTFRQLRNSTTLRTQSVFRYVSLILLASGVLYGGFSHTVKANDDATAVYAESNAPVQLTANRKFLGGTQAEDPLAPLLNHQAIVPGDSRGKFSPIRAARSFSPSQLAPIDLKLNSGGTFALRLRDLPGSGSQLYENIVGQTRASDLVVFTTVADLQEKLDQLISAVSSPHAVAVVMKPSTGEILALSEKTTLETTLASSATFPAASLFKIITTEAALSAEALEPDSEIRFRGGTYTLNKWNYLPDKRRDSRKMTLSEALGASCNPAFARVALQHLTPEQLQMSAERFGFNSPIPFEADLEMSKASIPESKYGFARTAAGFGEVFVSPIHAASFMSALAHSGKLLQPRIIKDVLAEDGTKIFEAKPRELHRVTSESTAASLLKMMESTTTTGTSRREFLRSGKPILGNVDVAGKTGTLRGKNPYGINNWFIGAAPIVNPEIAVSVVVVSPHRTSTRASRIARQILQFYFSSKSQEQSQIRSQLS